MMSTVDAAILASFVHLSSAYACYRVYCIENTSKRCHRPAPGSTLCSTDPGRGVSTLCILLHQLRQVLSLATGQGAALSLVPTCLLLGSVSNGLLTSLSSHRLPLRTDLRDICLLY